MVEMMRRLWILLAGLALLAACTAAGNTPATGGEATESGVITVFRSPS